MSLPTIRECICETEHFYANPIHTHDKSLGPVPEEWVAVYSDDTLVLLFKSRKTPTKN